MDLLQCCFVQVRPLRWQRNDLLGYEEDVLFWESFVSNFPDFILLW